MIMKWIVYRVGMSDDGGESDGQGHGHGHSLPSQHIQLRYVETGEVHIDTVCVGTPCTPCTP